MNSMTIQIDITDTSMPNTKRLSMRLWDGVSDCSKCMQEMFVNDIIPKELLKANLKEDIMRLIGDELDGYIDKALDNEGKRVE